ncbi:pyruvate:ferredoxin (flavodoxin) oxidoreductase [Clostridium luticellarii]|jgi:pyruvate-ferredoxin/flavodoxin oxidoreductase|uniref:Pyruvate:ferredoxin oxidoreductase n=1 Tax=Clostridium luticellarii TaxID=1691940 RepID=A0A2T0BQ98_9CLOT|nr:pyruvate:ferredoxin (flavodoxin) oxidoreductase [Clostridium luticellarii]MCI1944465.1 pyruvate:ferredoxin (flavodoxin) oxidoreductase [Clostridium luticellarii]MCI1967964.1 pyruvate:ferredoxin (flavodoxin) oxidoreductase [Clostridium luticellarii]MCI1995097.1 pyruvate:ferredoxin (flavodoxin) oxidoreductase [Clostridium luticellarii]MCI2039256.1 pyruvate:ferredoxin (flavodoxin) oxidoreductase [Clostridium luticellarii]PRR86036.1 Pyruvate-flavodoxin oxidoreductase [Clostridium luticellarii]
MVKNMKTMDGNQAAAYASYAFTEVAAIYPITPSTPMAEGVDEWSAHGKKNIFGQTVKVAEMQSEAGAAGAVHGSLAAGALTTTYTASQGLLLMIPNMYKIAGEHLPGVFHVSARAVAAHALSIFGDHQDVMACRQTGFALLASSNVQEAMDLGFVAHLSAIESKVPFLHFFDGFRTSHEYQKIEVMDYENIKPLVNYKAIQEFRDRALNPEHPSIKGTAQNPDIYFQSREVSNKFYERVPDIVEKYMGEINKITGRKYKPFDYYGHENAKCVIVAMGSVCDTIDETVDYLMDKGKEVGCIKVHLYRPFSKEHFLNVLPSTVKKISVLDRTKEPGSVGEPLYLDICKVFYGRQNAPLILGGRYGLGSKDTTPSQILSVFENMREAEPKERFTIGIIDDVTNTSLKDYGTIETTPPGTISCKFWGLGSDGTVGANKSAVKIIGDNTELYAQAYFSYDSKKSGGTTVSHLRFGKKLIKSPYLVNSADYIACHNRSFINNYDILKGLKKGGTFVLNCPWDMEELDEKLPASMKRYISQNNIEFYIVDAVKIAREIGLGGRINMVMQSVFFKLANVIPIESAISYLKESIEKTYGRKGKNIVEMNYRAVDMGLESVQKVNVPEKWNEAVEEKEVIRDEPDFVRNIQRPMAKNEGDDLPVSAFLNMPDGTYPVGTTAYEKRGIAVTIPEWQIDKCIQCNQCAFVCPHATIRAFLLNKDEMENSPESFESKKAVGRGLEGMNFRIQVSPMDCTGCGNCADICPAPGKALVMKPLEEKIEAESKNWDYAMSVIPKEDIMNRNTLKGSQFVKPLLEFNGACPGCGETPYIRLLTQLFGERMMIANATGCSSIWGASAPSMAYTKNSNGKGPSWGNSLFEDNAEYGYGMFLAVKQMRERLKSLMTSYLKDCRHDDIKEAFSEWLNTMEDGSLSKVSSEKVIKSIESYDYTKEPVLKEIMDKKDYLVKKSQWMIGGDGWAYDIGFGGVDHVLASGEDINMFVMDTEVYSNTGGQSSKATQTGAVAKFAASGKVLKKKDLGLMAMSYGYVYVAQIAMGANMNHALKVITEAENYRGPSLIIAYAPCINHGIKTGMGTSMAEEKKAVESGYWHLYRFNPLLKLENKNPFILDSKPPKLPFRDYIEGEIRFSSLKNTFPERVDELFKLSEKNAMDRYDIYSKLSKIQY